MNHTIRWFNRLVNRGGFLSSVLILVGGTAFAHGITALALPILTRLYTPADFNILAVFSSLLSIITVAACLRFDVAIPMPEHDSGAFNLLVLAATCTVAVALGTAGVVLFAPSLVLKTVGCLELEPYLWLLPIGIVLAGFYSALQNWHIREKEFSLLARSRVIQSSASVATQIGMALLGRGAIGLLIGYLLNTGAACIALGCRLVNHQRFEQNIQHLNWQNIRSTWAEYRRFPLYSTWEALANSAAIQAPVIMIAALTVGPEAGYLLLAMSVIRAPMALFGAAIGQVYLSRAPQEFREGNLGGFTAEILNGLIKAGVGPLLAVGILSPVVFGPVFGEGWERSGWLVAWMTPWFILQFLVTPISMAIHVTGNQRSAFILQVFGLLFRVASVWGAAQLSQAPVCEAYAISGALFYLIYLAMILHHVKIFLRVIVDRILLNVSVIAAWIASSFILALLASHFMK